MNIEEARNYVFSLPEKDRVKVGDLIESAMAAEQHGSREMRYDWIELSHIALIGYLSEFERWQHLFDEWQK